MSRRGVWATLQNCRNTLLPFLRRGTRTDNRTSTRPIEYNIFRRQLYFSKLFELFEINSRYYIYYIYIYILIFTSRQSRSDKISKKMLETRRDFDRTFDPILFKGSKLNIYSSVKFRSKTLTRRFSPDLLVVVVVVVVWAGGCPASWGTCCAGGVAPTVTPPVGIVAPTPVTIVQQQVSLIITKTRSNSTNCSPQFAVVSLRCYTALVLCNPKE